MLTLRGMKHIRTGRNIKSFRSCPHATGVSNMAHLDKGRILLEEQRVMAREGRRVWLGKEWNDHFERVAGRLRVLPPSARSQ